jgi:ATP-dependent RNA helicase DDX56/DBP9
MKRKLDQNDRPAGSEDTETPIAAKTEGSKAEPSFADLGLDARLVQAIAKLSYQRPTLVQQKAIPLALTGQDVLCKGKTGSGKTAAYVLPVLSTILKKKQVSSETSSPHLV